MKEVTSTTVEQGWDSSQLIPGLIVGVFNWYSWSQNSRHSPQRDLWPWP